MEPLYLSRLARSDKRGQRGDAFAGRDAFEGGSGGAVAEVEGLISGPVFVDGIDHARAEGVSGADGTEDFGRINRIWHRPERSFAEPECKTSRVQDHVLCALRL